MNPTLLRVCACTLLALTASASAEIIGVDTFDYFDGAIANGNGGTFWDYKNVAPAQHTGNASNCDTVFGTAPTVSSGRLLTDDGGAKREYNGANEADGAVNDANFHKVVYYRVIVTTGATLPEFFFLSSYDFGTERIIFGKLFGEANFGLAIFGQPAVNSTIPVQPNTTYTIVAKIDYSGNAISLYINPDLNAGEPAAHAFTSFPNTEWSTAVRLASGFNGDAITWDNLVVATTWEDLGTVVTTTADEDDNSLGGGAGVSLREAVNHSRSGTLVTFAPSLDGKTITLTGGELVPPAGGILTIDASALPRGLTIDGNNASRLFAADNGHTLTLRSLTLTGGNGVGFIQPGFGGAVYNIGSILRIFDCTFTGNQATEGGAVYSSTNFTGQQTDLTRCTITGNTAANGGAVRNFDGFTVLSFCTISGNAAPSGGGVSSYGDTATSTQLFSTILSANAGGDAVFSPATDNSFATQGFNLIGVGNGADAFSSGSGDQVGVTNPMLSPLGYYGGPTMTMHPLIGSPAIDTGVPVDPGGSDQRGFPRFVEGITPARCRWTSARWKLDPWSWSTRRPTPGAPHCGVFGVSPHF